MTFRPSSRERFGRRALLVAVPIALLLLLIAFVLSGHDNAPSRIYSAQEQRLGSQGRRTRSLEREPPEVRRRRLQLPYYMNCFRHPEMHLGEAYIMCRHINNPEHAPWRRAPAVRLDTSGCGFYTKAVPGADALLAPHDVLLRPNTTDHDVFAQVYCSNDFDFFEQLGQLLPRDLNVSILDAGANVGLVTELFMALTQFRGHVTAVDANPGTADVLRRNVARYGDRVTVVNAAIVKQSTAETGAPLTLVGATGQFWGFRVDHTGEDFADREAVQVPTRSLQQLRDGAPGGAFDFIKMDIEGEERWILPDAPSREVLCGAQCLFMELHERFEPGCDDAFATFMASGCPRGRRFAHVVTTGEYILVCQESLLQERGYVPMR